MRSIVFVLTALSFGCGEEGGPGSPKEPCDKYVDYMCDCHGAEDGFDCEQLSETLEGADQDVQDQCALDLGDQKQDDKDDGVVCDT